MAQGSTRGGNQDTPVRHKRGGTYYDDFVIGHLYEHPLTRTVTQMDNMLFSNMTLNPQPLHIDRHFCEQETEWGQPLMNSLFTLGLMIGISVNDLTVGTTVANLGMTEVKFPHPLFEGDTVHCSTTVLAKRESKSRPGREQWACWLRQPWKCLAPAQCGLHESCGVSTIMVNGALTGPIPAGRTDDR